MRSPRTTLPLRPMPGRSALSGDTCKRECHKPEPNLTCKRCHA